jgi:hypothetical protein
VFTVLLTKYAQLPAKFAQFVSICFYNYTQPLDNESPALSTDYHIASHCLLLSAIV